MRASLPLISLSTGMFARRVMLVLLIGAFGARIVVYAIGVCRRRLLNPLLHCD